jgi:hypothetical protein
VTLRRLIFSSLVVAIVALGLGVPALGEGRDKTIQTTASGAGTDTIPVLGGSTFVIDGTSTGTLGSVTFKGGGTQTGATTFTVMTTAIYRHGTITQSGTGIDTGPNTSTATFTIVSGTGRFEGATGSSTVMSTTTPTSNPQVREFTLTSTGTITLRREKH